MKHLDRRSFVGGAAAVVAAVSGQGRSSAAGGTEAASEKGRHRFFDLMRSPDRVSVFTESGNAKILLVRTGSRWTEQGIEVRTDSGKEGLRVSLSAPSASVMRIQLRWKQKAGSGALYLGDAWERSYGDLAWRTMVPERAMPWYFAVHEAATTHGYGVQTGAAAFCFWQVDPEGVSLWLDVSNGGMGVLLGTRELQVATVVGREGRAGEDPMTAVAELCRLMCPKPRLPTGPVFGTNDWYYAYGKNDAEGILRDTDLVVAMAGTTGVRPFSVIDDGWRGNISVEESARGNSRFPDMGGLAKELQRRGARPGIWIRPLEAPEKTRKELLLPGKRYRSATAAEKEAAYDPTIPEAMAVVLAKMAQVVAWGYELVKHDFSTYDLLGQWGFEMGAQPARAGWHFHDRSRTSAEIVRDLYVGLRKAAGDHTLLLGCNTVMHLGAGIFEMQRTGDDTSGRNWDRTRRMGVNTLAYRLAQNGTFHTMDADCVGITKDIPWKLNRQWMDLVARSGTALFLSPSPDAIGPEQRKAIAEAFALVAAGGLHARAVDWMSETTPERWVFGSGKTTLSRQYEWVGEGGCDPFVG